MNEKQKKLEEHLIYWTGYCGIRVVGEGMYGYALKGFYKDVLKLLADELPATRPPPQNLLNDAELTALRSDIERAREMMHSVSVRLANYAKGEIK